MRTKSTPGPEKEQVRRRAETTKMAQREPIAPEAARGSPRDTALSLGNQALGRQLRAGNLSPDLLPGIASAIGNQAIQRLTQRKVTGGPPNARYEQEADHVADHVMQPRSTSASGPLTSGTDGDQYDEQAHAASAQGASASAVRSGVAHPRATAPAHNAAAPEVQRQTAVVDDTGTLQDTPQNAKADGSPTGQDQDSLKSSLLDTPSLQQAFHNSPPLRANGSPEDIARLQAGLHQVGFPMTGSVKKDGPGGFGFDGIWGSETTMTVALFQRENGVRPVGGFEAGHKTLGALDPLLTGPAPQPVPPQPVPPQPVPPQPVPPQPVPPQPVPPQPGPPQPINPQTLGAVDAYSAVLEMTLTRQVEAIEDVRRDVGVPERPGLPLITEIMLEVGKLSVDFLYGFGAGAIELALNDAVPAPGGNTSLQNDFKNANNDIANTIFGDVVNIFKGLFKKEDNNADAQAVDVRDKYFRGLREAYEKAGFKGRMQWEFKHKPAILQKLAASPATLEQEPDLEKQAIETAYNSTYQRSVEDWAVYQARTALGQHKDQAGNPAGTELADPKKDPEDAAGVIVLKGSLKNHEDVSQGIQLDSASMSGLSKRTRAFLQKAPESLRDLHIPYFVEVSFPIFDHNLKIARNEQGVSFAANASDLKETSPAAVWLRGRATLLNGGTPVTDLDKAADLVLAGDVDKQNLQKIPGGLQGP